VVRGGGGAAGRVAGGTGEKVTVDGCGAGAGRVVRGAAGVVTVADGDDGAGAVAGGAEACRWLADGRIGVSRTPNCQNAASARIMAATATAADKRFARVLVVIYILSPYLYLPE
jgi:hypothetical protein